MVTNEDLLKLEREYKNLYHRVDQCMEKVDKVQDTTNLINNDLHQMLLSLRGNPMNKDDNGIIGMVMDNRERIEKLERFKDRIIWALVGASLFGGYAISDIVSKFLKH